LLNVNIGGPFGVFPRSQNQGFRPMGRSRPISWRRRGDRPESRLLGSAPNSNQEALGSDHASRGRIPR